MLLNNDFKDFYIKKLENKNMILVEGMEKIAKYISDNKKHDLIPIIELIVDSLKKVQGVTSDIMAVLEERVL